MKIVIDISKDKYDKIMSMDWKNCRYFYDEELKAIHDGKVLEQEPCDDCISRQAVMKLLNEGWRKGVYPSGAIMALPPVTPQPKMGRWIYTGDYITDGMLKCSECGFGHDVSERFSFCPNCGCKMQEVGK